MDGICAQKVRLRLCKLELLNHVITCVNLQAYSATTGPARPMYVAFILGPFRQVKEHRADRAGQTRTSGGLKTGNIMYVYFSEEYHLTR